MSAGRININNSTGLLTSTMYKVKVDVQFQHAFFDSGSLIHRDLANLLQLKKLTDLDSFESNSLHNTYEFFTLVVTMAVVKEMPH